MTQVRSPDFTEQVKAALPEGVSPRRFVRTAVTALLENPSLVDLERASVFAALMKSAADGLLPDGREAALVPFKGKAVYIPMIGGFRKIAAEHGWSIRSAVVYEADAFEFELGLEPKLIHRPARPGVERGSMIAAYAVGVASGRPPEFEVMVAEEIQKVRKGSRAADSGPWVDWPERMWEKTVGRRLFAKLPLGERDQDRIRRVLDVDELEPGQSTEMLYGPDRNGRTAIASATAPAEDQAEPGSGRAEAKPSDDGGTPEPAQPFSGEEPGGEQSQFKAPTAKQEAAGAGLVEITFGRHQGRTIQSVYDDDTADVDNKLTGIGYVTWLAGDSVKDAKVRSAAQAFLKGLS